MDYLFGKTEANEGVFNLITKLCEKFAIVTDVFPNQKDIKQLRSKCYDILLLKKISQKGGINGLDFSDDPLCHLLAWEFILRTDYDNERHADKLKSVCENIKNIPVRSDSLKKVLFFLICLKNPPSEEEFEGEFSNQLIYPLLNERKFWLRSEPFCATLKYSDQSFQLREQNAFKENKIEDVRKTDTLCHYCEQNPYKISCRNPSSIFNEDEGYSSPISIESDVWELIYQASLSEQRTWESAGIAEPVKELPFLCESAPDIANAIQNLKSSNFENVLSKDSSELVVQKNVIHKDFVKDVKYVLVGITSKTFQLTDDGEWFLTPGTRIEGLSPSAINAYCEDMLFCGACYKGLADLSTTDCFTGNYKQDGYIFKEVCESVKRYLSFYRIAILSIPDTINLLALREYIRTLQKHFKTLAEICNVGPYRKHGKTPNGVELLSFFYHKILTIVDRDVLMVLYSVFYPCCQTYFHRLLGQWILEGNLNDPAGEFFISPNLKYLSSRGRTYWSRSYSVKEDVIPDFIVDLKDNILACGKAMNLLKLCVPNSPFCSYIIEKKPTLLTCCITSEQLLTLEQNTYIYYLDAISKCGPQLSLEKLIEKKKFEEDVSLGLMAKKKAATLRRIELEKQAHKQANLDIKNAEIKQLRRAYDEAVARKKVKHIEQLEREIYTKEAIARMNEIEMKIVEEETENLINYYNELYMVSEKRKQDIERNIERMRKLHLDDGSQSSHIQFCPEDERLDLPEVSSSPSTESFYSFTSLCHERDMNDDFSSVGSFSLDNFKEHASLSNVNSFSSSNSKKPKVSSHKSSEDDIVNANVDINKENFNPNEFETETANKEDNDCKTEKSENAKTNVESSTVENFRAAQKNKQRITESNLRSFWGDNERKQNIPQNIRFSCSIERDKSHLPKDYGNIVISDEEKIRKENIEIARRNKAKFLQQEYGVIGAQKSILKGENEAREQPNPLQTNIDIAKRNKAKFLQQEYGIVEVQKSILKGENETQEQPNPLQTSIDIAKRNKAKFLQQEYGIIEPHRPTTWKNKSEHQEPTNQLKTNAEIARKNRAKFLQQEYGVIETQKPIWKSENEFQEQRNQLTAAEIARKNKAKFLQQEYGITEVHGSARKNESEYHQQLPLLKTNSEIARNNKAKFLQQEYGITEMQKPTWKRENEYQEQTNLSKLESQKHKRTYPEDIINANIRNERYSTNKQNMQKSSFGNFEAAKRNKAKIFQAEFGFSVEENNINTQLSPADPNSNLTSYQKNKQKILAAEYGIEEISNENETKSNDPLEQFLSILNEDYFNSNFTNSKKEHDFNLNLEFTKQETKRDKPTPMSLDTPFSEMASSKGSFLSFPSEELIAIDFADIANASNMLSKSKDESIFNLNRNELAFKVDHKSSSVFDIPGSLQKKVLPKHILPEEAQSISSNCLKLYLQQSIAIPLKMQMDLVSNQLLKFFIEDLHYLEQLKSLRNFFFLLDGQFGKNLTDKLFEKLYDANFPTDLINWRTLQILMQTALDGTANVQEHSALLSFRINSLPKTFDLTDPEVFDCISLTYKIDWPLNILIPSDTLTKYDEVFKLLLKLRRVSWVLQKIFSELKCLVKKTDPKRVLLLLMSPQYKRLHQCRHIMTHYVQTLQNYIHGEVLETNWKSFEDQLCHVSDLDQLYELHTNYIKNILFMCMLNQKSLPLRKIIHKILAVILKFYDYLRSRQWLCSNGIYKHPNFNKLDELFRNFEDIVAYFYKVGLKVARSGYQKNLHQLLDMLNINGFYTKTSNAKRASPSSS